LPRRQLRVQMQLVSQQADPPAKGRTELVRRLAAVSDLTARRRHQRGKHSDQRRLSCPVRSEQADNFTAVRRERHGRERPAPPEVPGYAVEGDGVEIGIRWL